jgi:poly(A) polymerase
LVSPEADKAALDRLAAAPAVRAVRDALGDREGVWTVGGAVRNAVLGREITDVDLAVESGEEEMARRIAKAARGHAFQLSDPFATWRVASGEAGWGADVARLRGPSIEADLSARDFTAGALAVPLGGEGILDPCGGLADLKAGILRVAGDGSFTEDPLRLLRAARLGAELGLAPDAKTLVLAQREAPRAAEPAGERQFGELRQIMAGPDPLRGLELMDELAITAIVLPELDALRGVIQSPNHHLDVYGHTLAVLQETLNIERDLPRFAGERAAEVEALLDEPLADDLDRRAALRFGALLHDLGKPATRGERGSFVTFIGHDRVGAEMIAAICGRLHTSRRLRRHLQDLTLHHLRLGFLVHQRPLPRRVVYEYLRDTEPVPVDVTLLTVADRLATRGTAELASQEMIEAHIALARHMLAEALDWRRDPPRPPISGDEVMAELGIGPGPQVGQLLEELRAAAFAGEISSREDAAKLARSAAD